MLGGQVDNFRSVTTHDAVRQHKHRMGPLLACGLERGLNILETMDV